MGRPPTILEVCVQRFGLHRGAWRAAHVVQWTMATVELGEVPTIDRYCEMWSLKERSGWYHAATCREVFGEDWRESISALAAVATARMSQREVAALELPPSVVPA